MKAYRYPRVYWLVIGLIFLLILYGCKTTTTKEGAPPEPSSKPSEPAPPSKKPSPSPTQPSSKPPPSKEVAPLPTEKSVPGEPCFIHTVKWSGETLFIIAAWYTGDRDNWRAIAQAMVQENPNVNIHRINIGNKIPVPQSLMKVQDPMPKDFVDTFYQKPKPEKEPPKPKSPPPSEDDLKLFGPKETPKRE